jgi:hypothetical protein
LSAFQATANETECVHSESLKPTEIALAFLSCLYKSKDWLLVVDNLDNMTIANGLSSTVENWQWTHTHRYPQSKQLI